MSNDDQSSKVDTRLNPEEIIDRDNEYAPILVPTATANGERTLTPAPEDLQEEMLGAYDGFIHDYDWGDRRGYHGRYGDPEMELLLDIITTVITTYMQEIDAQLKENPELQQYLGYSSVEEMITGLLDPAERKEMEKRAEAMIKAEKQEAAESKEDIADAFGLPGGETKEFEAKAVAVRIPVTPNQTGLGNSGTTTTSNTPKQPVTPTSGRGGYC